MSTIRLLRRAVLTVLVLGVAASVAAQPQRLSPAERQARFAESLNLSSAQAELVQRVLGDDPGPGSLWALAAELAPTLSDEQKTLLFTRPQRLERGAMRRDGERRERTRGERPERSDEDREARQVARHERQAAMQQAMVAALDLNPQQVERLDALREEHRAQRDAHRAERQAQREPGQRADRTRRAEPGQVPAELAEILNADQEAIWAVHRALAMRMHPRGAHRRGRH